MPRRKFTIPMSIVLFLAATLVGSYYVSKACLVNHLAVGGVLGEAVSPSQHAEWTERVELPG